MAEPTMNLLSYELRDNDWNINEIKRGGRNWQLSIGDDELLKVQRRAHPDLDLWNSITKLCSKIKS